MTEKHSKVDWLGAGFLEIDLSDHDGFLKYQIIPVASECYLVEVDLDLVPTGESQLYQSNGRYSRAILLDEKLHEVVNRLNEVLLERHVSVYHIGEVWNALASALLLNEPTSLETGQWLDEIEAMRIEREEVGFDIYPAPEDTNPHYQDEV